MPTHPLSRPWAALLFLAALAGSTPGYAIELPASRSYTDADLRNYAETLVAVTRVQRALAGQIAAAPHADSALLEQRAKAQIAGILLRHDLDPASFNAISARVENQPSVRARVNQLTMDEWIGS